MDETFLTLQR